MKLATFEVPEPTGRSRRIGILDEDTDELIDVTEAHAGLLADDGEHTPKRLANAITPPDMLEFLRVSERSLKAANDAYEFVQQTDASRGPTGALYRHDVDGVRLLSPLPRPNTIRDFIAFEEHLANFVDVPDEWYELPVCYKGNPEATVHPGETVEWPSYTDYLDYELELAAVIGTECRDVPVEEAMDHVFGYTIFNDFSARDIQRRESKVGLGPAKAKDFANGFGPVLVTADEIDVDDTEMAARIDGETMCEGNLGDMYHSFAEIIAHTSKHETLKPGDVLGSGTVGGGSGAETDRWLEPDEIVTLEVEGIGTLSHTIGIH